MTRIIYLSIILLLIGAANELSAQNAYFPLKGRITFEKEVYMRARIREMSNQSGNQNRGMMMRFGGNIEDIPEKNTSTFQLQFDEDETLMTAAENAEAASPGRSGATSVRGGATREGGNRGGFQNARGNNSASPRRNMGTAQHKVYYQNLQLNKGGIEIELDEKYLLQDSLQQITWRFTDEYRNIAGYECRRVNGATPDSLYLVAFYTDQIPLSGGPALVHGLPGMILGLAIPEMHINYWATKVDFTVDNVPKQWYDKKSKGMSMSDFFNTLGNNRLFGGGANGRQMRRNVLENLIY